MSVDQFKASVRQEIEELKGDARGVEWRSIMAVVLKVAEDGKLDANDAPAVSDFLIELYREYAVPLDIPYIPDEYESFVDELAIRAIPGAVAAILDRFAV